MATMIYRSVTFSTISLLGWNLLRWSNWDWGGYVMNIRYFSYFYFLSLYLLNKEIQRNTYLNPCSEFILNFLDLFTLKSLHFTNDRSYLNSHLCLSDYALFSNHDRGYADLSKHLWLCMSKRAGVFNHLFLYRFLHKYIYKYIKL